MKILIAEDEKITSDTLKEILRSAGYDIDFAFDGEEAMKKVKETDFDLVLLNIVMPKIEGYEVLRQIKEIYPKLPVVFVSGKGDAEKIAESISKYKLNGFIEKPFSPDQVLEMVKKILGNREE